MEERGGGNEKRGRGKIEVESREEKIFYVCVLGGPSSSSRGDFSGPKTEGMSTPAEASWSRNETDLSVPLLFRNLFND